MSEYTDYLQEVFEQFGAIQTRRMFGGYGIYHDGLMFALVSDDTLYLKADDLCRAEFEALGAARFEYLKNGRMVALSYYQAPEEIYDDPEEAVAWARRSYEAALRGRKK